MLFTSDLQSTGRGGGHTWSGKAQRPREKGSLGTEELFTNAKMRIKHKKLMTIL